MKQGVEKVLETELRGRDSKESQCWDKKQQHMG